MGGISVSGQSGGNYQTWDLCIARVPFDDISQSKVRPVLILNDAVVVVYVLKLTSQPPRAGEYPLIKWKEAGLHKPTVVRIGKRLSLSPGDIIRKIGRVHPVDRVEIMKRIQIS